MLRNDAGAPIAEAAIRLSAGGAHISATTDRERRFSFPAVAPADYSISVESRGATSTCSTRTRLPDDRAAALALSADGALSIRMGGQHEATGGERLSLKEVSSLPLNKRDFSQLLLLAAGAMTATNGAANFTQQFAVNGQRGAAAGFAMDGADISDPEMGGGLPEASSSVPKALTTSQRRQCRAARDAPR